MSFCVGCGGTSFRSGVLDEAKKKGWSEKQRKVALAYAYNYFLSSSGVSKGKDNDPLSDVDAKSLIPLPAVKYNLLSLDRVVTKIDQWLDDFDILLGYTRSDEVKFVDAFGLRPSLTHDEKVMMAVRARVKAAQLDRNFKIMLGQVPVELTKSGCMSGYNIAEIFGLKNPLDSFRFNFDQIDVAKKDGVLKLIEYSRVKVDRTFDHKEKDPDNFRDDNAFIWVSSNQELEISNFKILYNDKPENNIGNYIEGYRYSNGKKEGRPCLKVFMVKRGKPNAVFVIDTKREGDPGFGLPDFVEERPTTINVNDLICDQGLMTKLFGSRKEDKRTPPKGVPVYVEIAKSENPIDIWEQAGDKLKGFTVPFKYSNLLGSNYNIRVELSKTNLDVTGFTFGGTSSTRSIKYLKKEWTNGNRFEPTLGEVLEYYKVKPPYDTLKLISARVIVEEDTKRILFTKEDGSTEDGFISPGQNRFIEDNPIAIFYTEGEKRYIIKRSSGSLIFDKRRELSTSVTDKTGVYDDSLSFDFLR